MFWEADIMYFSFFGFRTLLTWIFCSGSAKVLHQGTTIGNVNIVRLVIFPTPGTKGTVFMCDALCVLCFAVDMFCVFVLDTSLSQDRLTEWVYSSVSTGWFGIVWAPTGSHKWRVESSQLRDFSQYEHEVEFRVWSSLVGIISQGDAWWL